MGMFEHPPFDVGTRAIAQSVAAAEATSIVGGAIRSLRSPRPESRTASRTFPRRRRPRSMFLGGTILPGRRCPSTDKLYRPWRRGLMNKEQDCCLLIVACWLLPASAACSHKPSYSETDAKERSGNQNQNQKPEQRGASKRIGASQSSHAPTQLYLVRLRPGCQGPSFMDSSQR